MHVSAGVVSQELLVRSGGFPWSKSIETLGERERRSEFRALLARWPRSCAGNSLSSALQQFPWLPALYSPPSGERKDERPRSGAGPHVAYHNQLEANPQRLVNAAIYPALLIGVGGLVSLFLLLYVVPRFSRIYESAASISLLLEDPALMGQLVEGHGALVMGALAVS